MTATTAGVAAAVGAAVHTATAPRADQVSPGLLGFVVVFALALATWLLLRSMVGHMRKVRYSPEPGEEPGGEQGTGADAGTGAGTSATGSSTAGSSTAGSSTAGAEGSAPAKGQDGSPSAD